jgi:hypothetical protein
VRNALISWALDGYGYIARHPASGLPRKLRFRHSDAQSLERVPAQPRLSNTWYVTEMARTCRRPLVGVVNKAPLRLQQRIYALSGGNAAVTTDKLISADVERIAQWVVA